MVGRRSSGFLSFGAFRCWGFIYCKENYTPVSYIATKIGPFEDEKGELSSWPLLVFGGVILIKAGGISRSATFLSALATSKTPGEQANKKGPKTSKLGVPNPK